MNRYSIQKMLGLIVLYSLIIVGIFALQFRNQSLFSKNFAQLRLTLSENHSDDKSEKPFDDTFFIAFKGITFYADEDNKPVLIQNAQRHPLIFQNWQELDENSFQLDFKTEEGAKIAVNCSVSGEEKDSVTLTATVPLGAQVEIPYKLSKSYTVTDSTKQKITLKSSNTHTILNAPQIEENIISLNSAQNKITYFNFKPVKQFQFAKIMDNPLAAENLYSENVRRIRNFCLTNFDSAIENLTENTVNAYMAEMTEKGRYLETQTKIPAAYRNGSRRTYETAPYLNNLVQMDSSLSMKIENLNYNMNYSLEKQNLTIFESENLASFLLTRSFGKSLSVLNLPSKISNFSPTLIQAVGIIETYTSMKQIDKNMSSLLEGSLEKCLSLIERSCSIENDILYVNVNNEKLDDLTTIRIGKALAEYGKQNGNSQAQAAGNMLVNCRIPANEQLEIQKAADIYSILMNESTYMPHLKVVKSASVNPMWAWTVAKSVTSTVDAEGTITIATTFPQDATHYMILKNVEPFKEIEIYGLKFRTDPRFESYNSSGYVYDEKTKTLYLKYRHKNETEIVRLIYKEEAPVVETPAPEAPVTEETAATPVAP